ncbi:MAG TPA: ribonuclease R [Polyangia bacterium]|nr:ribonuclease R [Polyangia bacterium]
MDYKDAITAFLARRNQVGGEGLKVRRLARMMGIADAEYGDFREAYKALRDSGRLLIGTTAALTLPRGQDTLLGRFQSHPMGFGFVVPEEQSELGDLFVPPDLTGGAMSGDLVLARVVPGQGRGKPGARSGEVLEIRERGLTRVVGTLEQEEGHWFVVPDGRRLGSPVVIRDAPVAGVGAGTKVVVDLIRYPAAGELPVGVIIEALGQAGEPRAEILSVIRAHGLEERFSNEALEQARRAALDFDPRAAAGREDLTERVVITIDPETARDYDDAVSLDRDRSGNLVLGVHIADVAHFVPEGSPLDLEARRRGTSVYFPRWVVPMLPETLSNGVCSLQEGIERYTKSVFVTYDKAGRVLDRQIANTVIRSTKRLTYEQAQAICDGKTDGFDPRVVNLVGDLLVLARRIEARRTADGMIHLDLPEVELDLDDAGRVTGAHRGDAAYTHTMIEMFMVEANEAVAAAFAALGEPLLRRIHPPPSADDHAQLSAFVRACGHKLPSKPAHRDLQALVEAARGRPEAHAINLALLRSFQRARYSTADEGHFALASRHYCHFTSPIRRYPDLTVHRALHAWLTGTLGRSGAEDRQARAETLERLAGDLSTAERRAQSAESEARLVLVLGLLAGRVGQTFAGVVTGVAEFGLFAQSPEFLVEGLIRLPDLGDDWWEVAAERGEVRGRTSGRRFRIGDPLEVRIAAVDISRRRIDLAPAAATGDTPSRGRKRRPPAPAPAAQRPKVSPSRDRKGTRGKNRPP